MYAGDDRYPGMPIGRISVPPVGWLWDLVRVENLAEREPEAEKPVLVERPANVLA